MQYVLGRFEGMIILLDLQNNGKMIIVVIIVGAIGPLAHPKTICYHCYEQFLSLQKHNDPMGAFHAAISNIVHHTILFLAKKMHISVWEPTLCSHGKYSYYDVFVAITLKQFSLTTLVQMASLMHRTFTCMHVI